jgi:hypothetical protein
MVCVSQPAASVDASIRIVRIILVTNVTRPGAADYTYRTQKFAWIAVKERQAPRRFRSFREVLRTSIVGCSFVA